MTPEDEKRARDCDRAWAASDYEGATLPVLDRRDLLAALDEARRERDALREAVEQTANEQERLAKLNLSGDVLATERGRVWLASSRHLRGLLPEAEPPSGPAAVGDVYEAPGVPVYWTVTKVDGRYMSAESDDGSSIGSPMPWTPPATWRLTRRGPP